MKSVIYLLKEFEGDEWNWEYVVRGFTYDKEIADKWKSKEPHNRDIHEVEEIGE